MRLKPIMGKQNCPGKIGKLNIMKSSGLAESTGYPQKKNRTEPG